MAALEPTGRSLLQLHSDVSKTLFVPSTRIRQQLIKAAQNAFLPADRSRFLCHWDVLEVPSLSPSPPPNPTAPVLIPAVNAGLLENCTGCVLCSEENGCITCHPRLFLLIWRDGIRQYGVCVHTCPPGYFGVRGLEVNRCTSTWCTQQGCRACGHPGVPLLPGASPGRPAPGPVRR